MKYIKFGSIGSNIRSKCRIIAFPSTTLKSNIVITVPKGQKESVTARLFSVSEFPSQLVDLKKILSESHLPNWLINFAKNNDSLVWSDAEIQTFINNKMLYPEVHQIVNETQQNMDKDLIEIDDENVHEADGPSDNSKYQLRNLTSSKTESNTLNRSVRGFEPYGDGYMRLSDSTISKMLILSAISLNQFDDVKKRQTMMEQAINYGVIVDETVITNDSINKLCQIHADHADGYARFESELTLQALPIDSLIHQLNSECGDEKFPISLGETNFRKFCRLMFTKEECQYLRASQMNVICRPIENQINDEYFGFYFDLDIPSENEDTDIPSPMDSNQKPIFFQVQSLPTYNVYGWVKSQIPVPDGLILSVMEDGATKLFADCTQNEKSLALFDCQTEQNIPIGYDDCIIKTFYGISTTCPG